MSLHTKLTVADELLLDSLSEEIKAAIQRKYGQLESLASQASYQRGYNNGWEDHKKYHRGEDF